MLKFRPQRTQLNKYQLPRWPSGKRIHLLSRRCGFEPWVGKIPRRRKWKSTPVFLPGKSHGLRSLAGYHYMGSQRVGHDLETKQVQHRNPGYRVSVIENQAVKNNMKVFSSVQFSCLVESDYLRPHESQHSRLPCPSPTPGVHSNSRPQSQ